MQFIPQKDWFGSRLFQAVAWAVLCAYASVQITALLGGPLNKYDDAVPLVSADLVLHGRKPAVDFWSFYPPICYYALATGFKLFGRTVLVSRFFAITLALAVLFAAARFFLAYLPHLRSLTAFMLLPVVVTLSVARYPAWPGFAMALLSLMVYLRSRWFDPPDTRWTVFAGALAGISTLIRFNFGPYVMLVACVDVLMNEVLPARKGPARLRLRRALVQVSALAIPFGLLNLIFYIWLYGANAYGLLWRRSDIRWV
jgi:hypothetical protein